ncbi:hypothetical protein ACOSP7_016799 [Xanthoceras sorbifolium]
MQYLLNTKKKMHFDPIVVLNHFVAPGVAELSTMGGMNAQGRSLDKRIRSRIAFFIESLTSEKKSLYTGLPFQSIFVQPHSCPQKRRLNTARRKLSYRCCIHACSKRES